jgi:hypothetical protein
VTSAPQILSLDDAIATMGEDAVGDAELDRLWRAGDLSYRLSAVQLRVRDALNTPGARRVGWLASRRIGKSRTASTVSAEKAYHYPGLYIPYAAPTGEQVETFIDPHFTRIANEAPPDLSLDHVGGVWITPPLQWHDAAGNPVRTRDAGGTELARFRGTKHEEDLRRSSIKPRGCDEQKKADRLRGPGTLFAVVDEARDIDILDYVLTDVLGPMMWEAKKVWGAMAVAKLFVCTTAPRRPDHPFVKVWELLKAIGAAIHSTIYDADHLTAEDIEAAALEAGGKDTLAWRREAEARIEKDPARAVFPEFSQSVHVRELERPAHYFPAAIGDGGFIDLALFLFGYYHFEKAAYVIERELVFQRTRSDAMDEAIGRLERELWPGVTVERRRVDASPQTRADMNRAEWGHEWKREQGDPEPPHWLPVRKPIVRGSTSMEAGVNRARVLLKQADKVYIHPRCERLIDHLDSARWNLARTEFERVKDEQGEPVHHYDGAAAFAYFLRDVSTANPVPDRVPSAFELSFRKPRLKKSEDEKLRSLFRPVRSAK